MKKVVLLLLCFWVILVNSQYLQYSEGYIDGHKKGYCEALRQKGESYCNYEGLSLSDIPMSRIGEDLHSYSDGFKRGYYDGQIKASRSQNQRDRYERTPRVYGDPEDIDVLALYYASRRNRVYVSNRTDHKWFLKFIAKYGFNSVHGGFLVENVIKNRILWNAGVEYGNLSIWDVNEIKIPVGIRYNLYPISEGKGEGLFANVNVHFSKLTGEVRDDKWNLGVDLSVSAEADISFLIGGKTIGILEIGYNLGHNYGKIFDKINYNSYIYLGTGFKFGV